jgi:hypothetical protein
LPPETRGYVLTPSPPTVGVALPGCGSWQGMPEASVTRGQEAARKGPRTLRAMVPVTLDDVRELALGLPRSYEAVVRGRVKFRVGQIVYVDFSHDGETMGFAFPKELRDALVQSEPHKFSLPSQSDMRFNWVHVRLAAIDADEMRDLVEGAWAMCVPKRVAAEYAASQGYQVEG